MEGLVLKKTVIRVDIYGDSVEIRRPTVGELSSYSKDLVSSDRESLSIVLDFLEILGLPKDKGEMLETEHLDMIVAAISPEKKS